MTSCSPRGILSYHYAHLDGLERDESLYRCLVCVDQQWISFARIKSHINSQRHIFNMATYKRPSQQRHSSHNRNRSTPPPPFASDSTQPLSSPPEAQSTPQLTHTDLGDFSQLQLTDYSVELDITDLAGEERPEPAPFDNPSLIPPWIMREFVPDGQEIPSQETNQDDAYSDAGSSSSESSTSSDDEVFGMKI